jgi:hypothetical protein
MHLFMVREPALDALAHLHPVARTPQALDFDAQVPALPPGKYRVYGDIVHESGYTQTLVTSVEIPKDAASSPAVTDADDSWFTGSAITESAAPAYVFDDGARIVWKRGDAGLTERAERTLSFSLQDARGAPLTVEPYMGMAAHVVIASQDGSVFAHLHPYGSIRWRHFSILRVERSHHLTSTT